MSGLEFLEKILRKPRSIAIIGASRESHKVGHIILKNLIESNFSGRIYPVNPKANEILGLKVYASILDIPDDVDIAVIAIPAHAVLEVVEECGIKRVPFIIVISAGFKEIGYEGLEREKEIVKIARKYGSRILGPNCLGYIDTHAPLNLTFAGKMPKRGGIGLISQSGALITALIDLAFEKGLGFSKIVSLGNKADLNENDFLRILANDENTKVIAMYLESVSNGYEFTQIAKQVSKTKPIIILKAGISEQGARAVSSHTGSLAGTVVTYETAFKQCGIVQVYSFEELIETAFFLSTCRYVEELNPVIITNAGGPGILLTDSCERFGIRLTSPSAAIANELRNYLPKAASIHNPIDILGDARIDRFEKTLSIISRSNYNVIIVVTTPQAMTEPLDIARLIIRYSSECLDKIFIALFMGGETVDKARRLLIDSQIPCFESPEKIAKVLANLKKYLELKKFLILEEMERPMKIQLNLDLIRKVIDEVKSENRKVLLLHEVYEIANACGLRMPEMGIAETIDEAIDIAEKIGYPVALKIISPQILHKTDVGCVKLNLNNAKEVENAFIEIMNNVSRYVPYARVYGIAVQKMVPSGKELIIGMKRDPTFGPLIMFGMGGIYAEIFKDVSFRLAPLSKLHAMEMIKETKVYTILRGYRGERPADITSLIDVLLKVSQLAIDVPEILELDINPLLLYEKEYCVVDMKIIVS